MMGDPYAKVGLVGVLLVGVWGLGVTVDRLGGARLVRAGGREGALTPEIPLDIPPPAPDRPERHTALVALSAPRLTSVDPGTVQVSTPGFSLESAQIHPIYEFRKETNPKPRSVLLLMDNSRSMVIPSQQGPPSDPDYRRLDAGRTLVESLTPNDRVSVACFPGRHSVKDEINNPHPEHPFEVVAPPERPDLVGPKLEALRDEENGATPLFRAVGQGAGLLAQAPAGDKRILVLLTDGKDTDDPGGDGLQRAAAAVKAAGIEMYAVGLGDGADMDVLRTMSGGHALRADDATALSRAFRQIALQMSRTVTQVDLDVMVGRDGRPIPPGQTVEITFRSGGKLYHTQGKTQ